MRSNLKNYLIPRIWLFLQYEKMIKNYKNKSNKKESTFLHKNIPMKL